MTEWLSLCGNESAHGREVEEGVVSILASDRMNDKKRTILFIVVYVRAMS